MVPREGPAGGSVQASLLVSDDLLEVFGVPWLVVLPSASHNVIVCMSAAKFPLFIRMPTLILSTSAITLFPSKGTF